MLLELTEEKYRKVVAYNEIWCLSMHNALIGWLSCIQNLLNIFMMLPMILARELLWENSVSCSEKITEPNFLVYSCFLCPQVKVSADINVACQRCDGLIYHSYSKSSTLVRALVSCMLNVVRYLKKYFFQLKNLDLYCKEGKLKFPGDAFNQYWKECMDNGYLSDQQKKILSNGFAFIKETVWFLFSKFPKIDFIFLPLLFCLSSMAKAQISWYKKSCGSF